MYIKINIIKIIKASYYQKWIVHGAKLFKNIKKSVLKQNIKHKLCNFLLFSIKERQRRSVIYMFLFSQIRLS
jgi:hypothetical protein